MRGGGGGPVFPRGPPPPGVFGSGPVLFVFNLVAARPPRTARHIFPGSRVIYGLLLTAVMVSSALIFSSGLPPLWQGMPVVGLAGFGIAALMAGYYVINLIRQYFRNRWK